MAVQRRRVQTGDAGVTANVWRHGDDDSAGAPKGGPDTALGRSGTGKIIVGFSFPPAKNQM